MFDLIQDWDQKATLYIQQNLSSHEMDTFFLMITNMHREPLIKWLFFPFLIFLIIRSSNSFWWSRLLMVAVGILISDGLGHRVIKPYFERPRPFNEVSLLGKVKYIGEAGGYSFPSNHAMNMFVCATLLTLFYRRKFWLFYAIAALVAYSRVYLGVHYMSDILAGAILGTVIGLLLSHFWPFKWRENSEKL